MPKAQLQKLMVIKMKKRRNQIVSIIGGALLVGLLAGSACAASDVPWPRETEDPYFYGYPENHNTAAKQNADVKAFKTQSPVRLPAPLT